MIREPYRFATRLMAAQAVVIGVGALTLIAAAALVARPLFTDHLARSGEQAPAVRLHAEQAFTSAFAIALAIGTFVALAAAGVVSWLFVRRVARPVAELADAADAVAAGRYTVAVPHADFSSELLRLSVAFADMAARLDATDTSRARLLADLAHEIRTPLATLEIYIDGMEDQVVPVASDSFVTMRAQVARLQRLATDIRDASAAQEHALDLHLEILDVRLVADLAAAAARPRFTSKSIDLTLDVPPQPLAVLADGQRLQQVLANLLDNALQHTPAGGHVNLSVTSAGRRVQIQVTDDGDGIPPNQLDAVFARFHRVDPSRSTGGGSGLGLTIVRAIVIDHGGSIRASSAGAGTGTSFTVLLPAARSSGPSNQ